MFRLVPRLKTSICRLLAGSIALWGVLPVGWAAKNPYQGEIFWNAYGVPSIYGADEASAFYGFGWAQTQSHGDLLLRLYGQSRARGAEYWGAEYEESDRWLLANDAPSMARRWYDAQKPDFRAKLDAFAAGINAYAVAHPEAIAPEVKMVLPVSGVDVIGHVNSLIFFQFVVSVNATLALPMDDVSRGGSNGWALAPSRVESGHSVLLQNPHLAWEASEQTYYEAHLNAPGVHLYGATQLGFPVIRFAFNERMGTTNTVNGILARTIYELKLSGDGYLFDGKVKAFERNVVSYRVKQPDGSLETKTLELRRSVHGPVFTRENGKTVALRIAGLDRPGLLQQYWDMTNADSFDEFLAAMKRLQIPTYNVIYADREGHVAYFHNGYLPKRSSGDHAFWRGLVPGDTSATLWTDLHPLEELPQVIDPPTGFVQNANEPPWWATYPQVIKPSDYPPYAAATGPMSMRAQNSIRMIMGKEKFSFEQLLQRKMSTYALMADRVLPELLDAARQSEDPVVTQAAALLAGWDRHFEADSRAALLFETWSDLFGGTRTVQEHNFAVRWDADYPLETPRGLKDPAAAVAMLKQAAELTIERYGALDRPFGDVSRFVLNGKSVPGHGGFGGLGIFRVMSWHQPIDGISTPYHGETWTALIEFSEPLRAVGLMSYGNASQPGTPHRSDQLDLLVRKEMRPLILDRPTVEAQAVEHTVFGK